MRDRVLRWGAEGAGPTRGEGTLRWTRGGRKLGTADLRWASEGESVAVVASVGPVRGLSASLRGDSLVVDLPRDRVFLRGAVPDSSGQDVRFLRFLVAPWRFGRGWARDALDRARVTPCAGGFCLAGAPEGDPGRELRLRVDDRAEPVSLTVPLEAGGDERLEVRFGKRRRYAAGDLPRWVEWSWRESRARVSIDQDWNAGPGLRLAFHPASDDTVYALDEPRGREILRALFDLPRGNP